MGTLPDSVELVAEPAPIVEMMVLGPEFANDVPAIFEQLPGLRVVQSFSAGVDHLHPLMPPGVTLCSAAGVHDASVSEWVVAAIPAMRRRLPEFRELQGRAEWNRDLAEPGGFSNHPIDDLEGRTVLVLGYGSIGRALAARLAPFGVRVVGVAQHARLDAVTPESLRRLLPEADVVVDLLPLTPATRKSVDADFFSRMKAGAIFVNAGRGGTDDTDAFVDALRLGRIRIALHVTHPAPLPADHPLWKEPNVLITPHIAGTVARWERRAYRFAGEQIRRYAAGEPLFGVQPRS